VLFTILRLTRGTNSMLSLWLGGVTALGVAFLTNAGVVVSMRVGCDVVGCRLTGRRLLRDTDNGAGRLLVVADGSALGLLSRRGVVCAIGGGVGIEERVLRVAVALDDGVRLGCASCRLLAPGSRIGAGWFVAVCSPVGL